MHRRQAGVARQSIDPATMGEQEPVDYYMKCFRATLELLEGWCDIIGIPNF
jgi:hypothetical protein